MNFVIFFFIAGFLFLSAMTYQIIYFKRNNNYHPVLNILCLVLGFTFGTSISLAFL